MYEHVEPMPRRPTHVETQGTRLSQPRLGAILAAAIAAYLDGEAEATPLTRNLWALAARPDGREAGSPWPLELVGWRQAERPR